MKLYVWTENILADYTSGMAVAVAETVDEARKVILKYAHDVYWAPNERNNEFWWDFRDREMKTLEKNLAASPDRIEDFPAAALIGGGG